MTGLLGFAFFYSVVTSSIDVSNDPTSHFADLNSLVTVIKSMEQQENLNMYNPLIRAICKGDLAEVIRLKDSSYKDQKVQGLNHIHWAVIAKQDEIYDFFAKQPDNLALKTTDGLLPFELSIKYKAWDQDQIQNRESQYH